MTNGTRTRSGCCEHFCYRPRLYYCVYFLPRDALLECLGCSVTLSVRSFVTCVLCNKTHEYCRYFDTVRYDIDRIKHVQHDFERTLNVDKVDIFTFCF